MAKKPKTRRTRISETYSVRTAPNWPLLALSTLGMLLTAYLTFAAFTGSGVQGCSVGGGCDTVLTSRWSKLFGLPTSLWGFVGYASLAAVAFVRRTDRHWSWAWTLAVCGVFYSVYLTVVSLTILQSACPYCLTSLALMTAILTLVVMQRPAETARRQWVGLVATRAVPAAVVIFALHANYTAPEPEPTGPEDPIVRALAEHLKTRGVLFYGASWCPHCQEQKRLFGASASRLPYVECNLAGPSAPQSAACSMAGVRTYPTWIINGRPYVGQVMTLAQLADATGFPGAANFR